MLFPDDLVLVRGGGDLGSGVVHAMARAGFPVIVVDLERPRAIRRTVSFSTAIDDGSIEIEGLKGVKVADSLEAVKLAADGFVSVMSSETIPHMTPVPSVLVDARMTKRSLDTALDQAPFVVGLGPGFTAGVDCDVVIETKRGHRLGRVIDRGSAEPDTGVPGEIEGIGEQRVMRAASDGSVSWSVEIGDLVKSREVLGHVGGAKVTSPITGVVRGLISDGYPATAGMKIADVDPRGERFACFEISDKARLVGAGALTASLAWMSRSRR